MNREELKALGLEDEQIDAVMKSHGTVVNQTKEDLQSKETKIENLEEQLTTANKEIEDFKELNIDEIKQRAEDYKTKFEEAQIEADAKLEEVKFRHTLENTLKESKARNTKAVEALLDIEGLKFNDGKIIGLDDQLEAIKEENDYLFDAEEEAEVKPGFTRPNGKGKANGNNNPFSKEAFNLTEQGRLIREDRDKAIRLREAAK